MILTHKIINEFLNYLHEKGRVESTVENYGTYLRSFYRFLPRSKRIKRDTISEWKQKMLEEGLSEASINCKVSAVNSLLSFVERRDLQDMDFLSVMEQETSELTRAEYIRLLKTAKAMDNEKIYLLIKLFTVTGLPVQNLHMLTVETVGNGYVPAFCHGSNHTIRIPELLRGELLSFAERKGITAGPIFVSNTGKPIDRNHFGIEMKKVCSAANVQQEKINPRFFKKLYQQTMDDIRSNMDLLIQNAYDTLLAEEQEEIGWTN